MELWTSEMLFAIMAIVLGTVSCFAGHRAVRRVMALWGMVYGFWIASTAVPADQWFLQWLLGATGGFIGAIVAYLLVSISILFWGVLVGFGVGLVSAVELGFAPDGVFLLSMASGVVAGGVLWQLRDLATLGLTALGGTLMLAHGFAVLFPNANLWQSSQAPFGVLVLGCVTMVGFATQYDHYQRQKLQKKPKKAKKRKADIDLD